MTDITLNADTLRLLALFEKVTGAPVKDVVEEEDRFTFVVDEEQIGRAIGRSAMNLKRLREMLRKDIEMIGYSADREKFVANMFHRYTVESIEVVDRQDGVSLARVKIDAKDKGKAIGRGGRNVQVARELAARHHGLKDVIIE